MKNVILVLVACLALAGCATVAQVKADAELGATTPLEVGEVSPQAEAGQVVDLLKMVPVVGPYAPILGPLLAGFFLTKRGRRIRKGVAPSPNPITGAFGPKIGFGSLNLENIVQVATDIFKGAFEVGPDGSAVKRGWKTVMSIGLGLLGGAFLIPGVKELVLSNPQAVGGITLLAGFFSGIEKKLQDVKPVVLTTP
jgi:hypothetical protein